MLSRPFRAMPRARLILLLVVLLALEAAGGFGLYVNNRPATAAALPPPKLPKKHHVSAPSGPAELRVQNTPRTVLFGHSETFSVQLKNLKNVTLTYTLIYPDFSQKPVKVQTDSTGFSKQTFLITYKPHSHRETISIQVKYNDKVEASTDFAVQLPTSQPRT